jgi:hypothetical protein
LTSSKKIVNRFGIVLVIIPSDEVNGVATLLFVLVEPQVSAYGYLLTAVVPFIFRAGALQRFALTSEQFDKVNLTRGVLLIVSKIFVFCYKLSLSLTMLETMRLTLGVNYSS